MMQTRLDLGAGGIEVAREIVDLPRWPSWATAEQGEELVRAEARLRDDLGAYGMAFDAPDLDAGMTYFADDVVIANPRGRYSGADRIRKNYEFLFEQWPLTRHVWS